MADENPVEGEKKFNVQLPPPPKPLSFEMPKPPVLQPPIFNPKPSAAPTSSVNQPIPNPFAARPKSVSPRPETSALPVEKIEKPSNLETLTTEIPITPMVEEAKQMTSPAVVEVSHEVTNKKETVEETNMFTEKVDMSGGLMSWLTKTVAESKLLSDVAEKAKAGVESVMTTLDPGMKPFLAEHGVIEFAVFNCDSETVGVASDAFTKAGAMAICRSAHFDETGVLTNFRPLVLGEQKATQLVNAKIEAAKKSKKAVEEAAVVVVQPFLLEIGGRYYSTTKVALHHGNTTFDAIAQLLEVPSTLVEAIQRSAKSEGIPENEFSISMSQAIKNLYKSSVNSWEPGSLPPYESKELLSLAFCSVAQQLLRNLAPVN